METFLYLRDDNEEEDDEIKALVDSGANLSEVDTLADENYALNKGLKSLRGFLCLVPKCDTI